MKVKRQSNLELLRIISIFMIIIHHFAVKGTYEIVPFDKQSGVLLFLGSLGKAGVDCFVLIGSYFLVKSKIKLSKVVSLVINVVLYSYIIWILFTIAERGSINDGVLSPIKGNPYWFAKTYCVLLMLSPILNIILKNCSSITLYRIGIVVLTIVLVFLPFKYSQYNFCLNHRIFAFLYIYLLAGYIRKTEENKKDYRKIQFIIGVCFSLLSLIITILYIIYYMRGRDVIESYIFFNENGVACLLLSIGLFLIFKNWKLNYSKKVNYIAASTLGVYFIHDNRYVAPMLWDLVDSKNIHEYMALYAVVVCLIIFIVCCILDILKRLIFDKLISSVSEMVEHKVNTIFGKIFNYAVQRGKDE
jgi:surface polysaccharide O-acyltransferase-like enzyme